MLQEGCQIDWNVINTEFDKIAIARNIFQSDKDWKTCEDYLYLNAFANLYYECLARLMVAHSLL